MTNQAAHVNDCSTVAPDGRRPTVGRARVASVSTAPILALLSTKLHVSCDAPREAGLPAAMPRVLAIVNSASLGFWNCNSFGRATRFRASNQVGDLNVRAHIPRSRFRQLGQREWFRS